MTENKTNDDQSKRKSFRILSAIAVVLVVCLLLIIFSAARNRSGPNSELATFVTKRGPLTISVLESGTIKAREQIIIKNEVEGRTSIITLIPEGTHVKKGDLLVELDASALEDNKIDQEILWNDMQHFPVGGELNRLCSIDNPLDIITGDFIAGAVIRTTNRNHPL